MAEAKVIFNYNGSEITIQCNINDKMKDIIDKFVFKACKKENNLYYLYNGNNINFDLTFDKQANDFDKNRKIMNIIVSNNDEDKNNEIISKDIICPECKENALIDINNFKINLSGCKNNHIKNNILLNEFDNYQKIDLSKIICDICNKNNKSNTHKNIFYICNTCNKNICPLCKSIHDKNHIIINYEDKNYICKKHNDSFIKYCKTCKENICFICENKHKDHNIFDYKEILIDKDDLLKLNEDLKNEIDRFKYKINIIKEIFDKIINTINLYYKINNDIINNYNINKRNYYKLQNLYNIKNNNEIIIKYLDNIINNNKIFEIYKFRSDYYYNNNNGDIYIGEMKNSLFSNIKEGKGIMYYYDSDSIYEGDWKNDIREGKGIFYYKNGDIYEGECKNDVAEGKGIFYWSNGDRYEGEWKNNEKEGKGIKYYKNGKIEDGNWKNNNFIDN